MLDDRLVDQLVADLRPVRRRSVAVDAAIMLVLCGLELAAALAGGMIRPDMRMADMPPSFWWKVASLALVAIAGMTTVIRSLDPVASPRPGLRWITALVVACLIAGWFVAVPSQETQELAARLSWHRGMPCVTKMVLLSLPAILALGLLMRRAAPTEPDGTALAAGIASAAWGAFVFAFACPYDDPFFITVWYLVGCGIVTVLARVLLPRLTRW